MIEGGRMEIVPATLTHLPALRRQLAELAHERVRSFPASIYPVVTDEGLDQFLYTLIEHFRRPDPSFLVAVAVAGEIVLGSVGAQIVPRIAAAPHRVVFGHWLYVTVPARGHGVGRGLSLFGAKWAHELGVETAECEAVVGDAQWAARGWRPHTVKWHAPLAQVIVAAAGQDEAPPAEAPATITAAARAVPARVEPPALPPTVNGKRRTMRRRRAEATA